MIGPDDDDDNDRRVRQIVDAVLLLPHERGDDRQEEGPATPTPSCADVVKRAPVSVVSPEVYEYLVELLKQAVDDDDKDDDALIDTVASFLDGEEMAVNGDCGDGASESSSSAPSRARAARIVQLVRESSRSSQRGKGEAGTKTTAPPPPPPIPSSRRIGGDDDVDIADCDSDDSNGGSNRPKPAKGGSLVSPTSRVVDEDAIGTESGVTAPGPARHRQPKKRRDPKKLPPAASVPTTTTTTTNPLPPRSSTRGATYSSNRPPDDDENASSFGEPDDDDDDDNDHDDDFTSAWREEGQDRDGRAWGGRGRGGRGEYAGAVNSVKSNIHLSHVSLALPTAEELLVDSVMDIAAGHCYGLLGRNGAGKSTLLRRIANKSIPGLPRDLRVLLVSQEMDDADVHDTAAAATAAGDSRGQFSITALEALVQSDRRRTRLLREQQYLERRLDDESDDLDAPMVSADDVVAMGERLGQVMDELEITGADQAVDRARDILAGLQFTQDMMDGPASRLSGGWRMRLKLARALFLPSDLILFDECTNHLDLYGLEWLTNYLISHRDKKTLMVVSHDRTFLDAICTDIVVLEHRRLTYHPGNYTDYERQVNERAARESQILDAAERQRSKAAAFVQKQQQQAASSKKKWVDPNKQRQAKTIRDKKLDRIGNYRDDGKRYKTHSLQKLSEEYSRQAQKVVIEADDPVIAMHFPDPVWPAGISVHDALIKVEDYAFGYDRDKVLFEGVTLNVTRRSKVCVVGRNGSGKSTLVNLFAGAVDARTPYYSRGTLWVHPNVRIGHVTQYAVESLGHRYGDLTTVRYAEQVIFGRDGPAASSAAAAAVARAAGGNVRQYLGAFGLGGRHALQNVGRLSGGERMRLCFATVLAQQPHVLLLDESTNHVDLSTLDSMSQALRDFQGAVVMVSHNQGFLSGFCNELWVVDDRHRRVHVHPSDASSFDEIFSRYRTSIHSARSGAARSTQRRERADRAKVASHIRAGSRQAASLL